MNEIEDEHEKVMEYLVPVSQDELQQKLDDKLKEVKKLVDRFDISEEVGKFYRCEAKSRRINGKHIGAPAGYRPLDRKLRKIGFSGYEDFLQYDEEERDEKIEKFVKDWITYVDRERYRELKKELIDLDVELPEVKRFPELGKSYKTKMEKLEEIEEEMKEMHQNWKEKKEPIDEKLKDIGEEEIEKFSEGKMVDAHQDPI